MAIAFDIEEHIGPTGLQNPSLVLTPVGIAKGIIVLVNMFTGTLTMTMTATYGGVPMIEVPGSPLVGTGELGTERGFFLGTNILAGAQTVQINTSDVISQQKVITAISVTAGTSETKLEASSTFESLLTTAPFVTLVTRAGIECFVAGVMFSGDAFASETPGTDYTEVFEVASGGGSCSFIRRTVNSTGGNVVVDWTQGNNDAYVLGVAVAEFEPIPEIRRVIMTKIG
jgi:hypothetical protein